MRDRIGTCRAATATATPWATTAATAATAASTSGTARDGRDANGDFIR
jgi:hypothetical protein